MLTNYLVLVHHIEIVHVFDCMMIDWCIDNWPCVAFGLREILWIFEGAWCSSVVDGAVRVWASLYNILMRYFHKRYPCLVYCFILSLSVWSFVILQRKDRGWLEKKLPILFGPRVRVFRERRRHSLDLEQPDSPGTCICKTSDVHLYVPLWSCWVYVFVDFEKKKDEINICFFFLGVPKILVTVAKCCRKCNTGRGKDVVLIDGVDFGGLNRPVRPLRSKFFFFFLFTYMEGIAI